MVRFIKGIRVRVYMLFSLFTVAILLFLYAVQVWFFPVLFNIVKTREVIKTSDVIKDGWDNPNLQSIVDNAAVKQGTFILVARAELRGINVATSYDRILTDFSEVFNLEFLIENPELLRKTVEEGSVSQNIDIYDEKSAILYTTYVGTPDDIRGYILIFSYLEPVGNTSSTTQSNYLINAALILLISNLLSAFIIAQISNPIVGVSRSANKLVTGDFKMEVSRYDSNEIRLLKENLNKASEEISKTESLRKDLMANISHDLKTPLTMIKAYAEMIRDLSGNNPEKRGKHLEVIIDETNRLNSLVIDILDLSKLQSGVTELSLKRFDFSQHLSGIVSRFSYLSDEYKVKADIEDGIFVTADITKLEQVVYNLIANAINYTGESGVVVRLFNVNQSVARLEVTDSGKGIAPEQLPYIWERYYKADNSVNHKRAVMGTGLGLSIVKNVLELHKFNYGVDSALNKGSRFWFEFKK